MEHLGSGPGSSGVSSVVLQVLTRLNKSDPSQVPSVPTLTRSSRLHQSPRPPLVSSALLWSV